MLFALTTVPGGGGQAGFPPHQSDRPPWTTGEEETAGVAVIIAPFVLRLHFCVAAVGLPALRVRGGLGVVACYHYGGVGSPIRSLLISPSLGAAGTRCVRLRPRHHRA